VTSRDDLLAPPVDPDELSGIGPETLLAAPRVLGTSARTWRDWSPPAGDPLATPEAFTEAVRWIEPARFLGATIGEDTGGLFEIVRIQLGATEQLVLERLSTFLHAERGQVVYNSLAGQDPSISTIADGLNVLAWRWHLRFDNQIEPVAVLNGGDLADLPELPLEGLAPSWADQRYQWGERLTTGLSVRVYGPGFVRLFVEFEAQGDPWSVRFGGLLGAWRQLAGPLGASLRTTVERG